MYEQMLLQGLQEQTGLRCASRMGMTSLILLCMFQGLANRKLKKKSSKTALELPILY
jgi:hypothetical protein